ncbi:hypothetical protein SERLA73DRAFT_187302 [Serpula lacrymans var. lacrymans S7.3]|uniref:Carbohydrate-binding module family 19 domain-containing protein n=1 Tax=Serpula lacrymans var. lacrymans (strain S7.3) TaxID=936435 RepID=F8Q8W7_SERL3|nr:hypothetical protein SERLA73DRAFT_187302 [Serpula lacrymans var. lacrymans S7.3]
MVQLAIFTVALAAASVNAAPLWKRIQQTISDSTTKWEAACTAAGGGQQCNPVAVASFGTLLAAPGACAQQDAADNMIDLAKTLNNDPNMIKFAQIFAQQPRNSPTSQSVPYCQSAPRNAELNGLYQCQWQGDDAKTFVGGIAVGGNGTIPFGMSSPLSPAGSCPANPSGPITNGAQLTDLTQSPGVGSTSSGSSSGNSTGSATPSASGSATAPSPTETSVDNDDGDCDDGTGETTTTISTTSSAAGATPTSSSGNSSLLLSNGQAAQKLNAQFASLTANSTCTEGTNACVNGDFAQCVSGTFVTSSCGSTLTCAALPLVNSAGTSITCTTTSDAQSRIAATGAQGGLTGSGSS